MKLNKVLLKFNEQLESKYMLNKVVEESGGLKMVFIALAIINPAFIALDLVRLESPMSSVYTRVILEVIFVSTILIIIKLKKTNAEGHQVLFFISSFATYCYLLISDYVHQGEYYEIFAANITVFSLFINGSFIGLRFRHSVLLNFSVMSIFMLYALIFSTEPFHADQVPFIIIFFVVCSILSYLFEMRSRNLFKGKEYIEVQHSIIMENNKKLETQSELKNSLMSILTHDIKSPLNSLEMLLKLESKDVITREDTINHFNKIGLSVKSISSFVSSMILWIKSQMDGLHVNKSEVNVRILVDQIIEMSNAQAAQKQIVIDNTISDKHTIMLDEDMMSIVIRNILSNAIKYSHNEGKVTIKGISKSATFGIQIIDAGIGMDENQIESLFSMEVKNSTLGTKNETGTGLGLLLSYNLMQKMEGSLQCKSIPTKGSIFTIVLNK